MMGLKIIDVSFKSTSVIIHNLNVIPVVIIFVFSFYFVSTVVRHHPYYMDITIEQKWE